jgi:SAM-dependent methyltransferase
MSAPDRFLTAYDGVAPPWDIGRAQPALVAIADAGDIAGDVLDVGCGTGENALHLAGRGLSVWGVDAVPAAIDKACAKAKERGIAATFLVHDALALETLARTFDCAIDSGLFHVFPDEDRPRFVWSLASVLRPGARYHLLCFSDRQPGDWGPRRVSQTEIHATFEGAFVIDAIHPVQFTTNLPEAERVEAWHASMRRR